MSDPVRLLEGEDALAVQVLASARQDAAPRHLHNRVHAALGLGALGAASTTATTAAATATKGAGLLASVGVAKLATVVALAGIAATGVTAYVMGRPVRPPSARHAEIANATVAVDGLSASAGHDQQQALRPMPAPLLDVPIAIATATPPTAASTRIASTAPTSTGLPNPATAPTGTSPTLVEELAPIDAARTALDEDDTTLALRQLDRYDLDYPHGRLAPEALALRVEVYARRHDDTKVIALGKGFLKRYPEHPQTARVRAIVDRIAASNNP